MRTFALGARSRFFNAKSDHFARGASRESLDSSEKRAGGDAKVRAYCKIVGCWCCKIKPGREQRQSMIENARTLSAGSQVGRTTFELPKNGYARIRLIRVRAVRIHQYMMHTY